MMKFNEIIDRLDFATCAVIGWAIGLVIVFTIASL
jgi:hypothetical protein